jgi:5-methylcytosine-specific restriction enzyme subunit McrC
MRIDLQENGDSVDVRLSDRVGVALRASGIVTAAPALQDGWWTVGPNGKVGVARVAGIEIWVEPKVSIRRLFFLLGYASDHRVWRDEDLGLTEERNLLAAIATAFARQADKATQQGLLQGYRVEETASTVLRGRLRTADQLKRRFGLAIPLEVRFDEYGVDIPENQLLRGAAERLLSLPEINTVTRRALLRLMRATADVTSLSRGVALPVWQPSRLNARYQLALHLAAVVLRGGSVEQAGGVVQVNGFMLDMAQVFESFLACALGNALRRQGGHCKAQDRWHLDEAESVPMRPDLVWYRSGSATPAAVIDAKYKAEKPSGYPNADLYQMLAYCTVSGLRHGHLVYAKGNEPEAQHRVLGTAVEIAQHALDLDASPEALLHQVEELAVRIAKTAT